MVLEWGEQVIYVDPVGGKAAFDGQPAPDLILVTDIHGDHLNAETLAAVSTKETMIIVPQAVADKLDKNLSGNLEILDNGQKKSIMGIKIEGIPMYNLREEALKFHVKGRGNGYVLEKDGDRVYISGDTEDIPEMRNLKDIDLAFVCMNLPYTMTVESAANAVLDFAPETVIPYHYRGTEGLSDTKKFSDLVTSGNSEIEVVQFNWYPSTE
jgi:L-ascorbate metabolism protein UlaG (beta-lactamase superfamily)